MNMQTLWKLKYSSSTVITKYSHTYTVVTSVRVCVCMCVCVCVRACVRVCANAKMILSGVRELQKL